MEAVDTAKAEKKRVRKSAKHSKYGCGTCKYVPYALNLAFRPNDQLGYVGLNVTKHGQCAFAANTSEFHAMAINHKQYRPV